MLGGLDSASSAPLAPRRRSGSRPVAGTTGAQPLVPGPVRAFAPLTPPETETAGPAAAPGEDRSARPAAAREVQRPVPAHRPLVPTAPPVRPNQSPRSAPPPSEQTEAQPRPRATRRLPEPSPEPSQKPSGPPRRAERRNAPAPAREMLHAQLRAPAMIRTPLSAPPIATLPGPIRPPAVLAPPPKPAPASAKPAPSAKSASAAARPPIAPRAAATAPIRKPDRPIEPSPARQLLPTRARVEIRQIVRETVSHAAQEEARATRTAPVAPVPKTRLPDRAAPRPVLRQVQPTPRPVPREKPNAIVPVRQAAAPQRPVAPPAAPRISIEIGRIDITARQLPKPVARALSRVRAPRSHSIDPGLRSGGD